MRRRSVLAGLAALVTAGCSKIGKTDTFQGMVDGAEKLHLEYGDDVERQPAEENEEQGAPARSDALGHGRRRGGHSRGARLRQCGRAGFRLRQNQLTEDPTNRSCLPDALR